MAQSFSGRDPEEEMRGLSPNHWVQATPDCALLFVVAQVSGAPDAARWAKY